MATSSTVSFCHHNTLFYLNHAPVTLCGGELCSILVVRPAYSAILRSRLVCEMVANFFCIKIFSNFFSLLFPSPEQVMRPDIRRTRTERVGRRLPPWTAADHHRVRGWHRPCLACQHLSLGDHTQLWAGACLVYGTHTVVQQCCHRLRRGQHNDQGQQRCILSLHFS